ncbi:hypothetical protein [Pyrodictium abyssi]|uniref:PIN domain-containing protein n=1 Tax=Pyrodictium abyssi TaxID=54256 RepID=A0ABN6ZUK6_9CREN|nr:hypothetical protein PABY_10900 [Pyrodictium abyssi]
MGIALEAAKQYMRLLQRARSLGLRAPSLADAIVYTTAILNYTDLVTGDKLFKGLDNVIYIGD